MKKSFALAAAILFAAAALLFAAPRASAHSTGDERRTVRQCQTLGSRAKVKACIRCVNRAGRFHYHPFNPKGQRCRPDNGKP